ncbi:NAD(P)/FAD-dependent oxidoreductase [Cupriavidus oxalaticus]|uniref:NAD(P)/FAD-dependent oxidoreductase n=1 Tax=Cupriavidus oxalaticus TaxID=96344 RepID=UPI004033172D
MSHANPQRIAIIGGGQAAGAALRKLRTLSYGGTATVICAEPHYPYERPPLSKDFLHGATTLDALTICKPGHPREQFHLGNAAERIDRQARVVHLRSGSTVPYDKLLIATGGEARRLSIPGADDANILHLRTARDAEQLRTALDDCQASQFPVLVVGGGWVGLEIAAAACQKGLRTTLIESSTQLCGRTLPAQVATELLRVHQAHGVDVRVGCSLATLRGHGRTVDATLSDGSTIPAGLVVAGIGLVPNTWLAVRASLAVGNGIRVDADGRTSDPDIYAVGDVAEFPCAWHQCHVRMETWHNANTQAERAVYAMLESTQPSMRAQATMPWFWSDQFGLNLQVLGAPLAADETMAATDGDGNVLHVFGRQSRLIGAIGMNRARDIRVLKRAAEQHPALAFARVTQCMGNLGALL